MPVQYVIGEWDFRDLTLDLRPPVFIPRPETEVQNFTNCWPKNCDNFSMFKCSVPVGIIKIANEKYMWYVLQQMPSCLFL